MSETPTGATAEAPPAVTPEAPAVETAVEVATEATEQPLELERATTKAGARSNARKRAEQLAKTAEAARERALQQPRKDAGQPEGGQFTTDKGEPGQAPETAGLEPPVATDVQDVAAGQPEGTEAKGQATTPAGFVDIPLPEGHPWRDRGRTYHRVSKEQEIEGRAGVNAAMKLRSVESERDQLRRDIALLEARRQALSGDLPDPTSDPAIALAIEQIREADWGKEGLGDEMAEKIAKGLKAEAELRVLHAERQAEAGYEIQRTASRIAGEIESAASEVLAIWKDAGEMGRMPGLISQYFAAVDTRNERDGINRPPAAAEFFEWVKPLYRADPRVQAKIQQIQRDEQVRKEAQIRAEVQAEFERKQAEKAAELAQRHATRPPTSRALPSTSTPVTEEQAAARPKPTGPGSYKNIGRQRAREIAARYMPPS